MPLLSFVCSILFVEVLSSSITVFADPILIHNCQELQNMANNLTANYSIVNNIDCTNFVWTPIATNDTFGWQGNLEGNNYTIFNFSINLPNSTHVAMFGKMYYYSIIQNLKFLNANIIGKSYVGIICGETQQRIQLINIIVSQASKIQGTANYIGGLCGDNYYAGTVRNVIMDDITVEGLASTSASSIGGIIGWTNGINISHSIVTGIIKSNGFTYVGGVVGYDSGLFLYNVSVNAIVSGDGWVGGLIGYQGQGCYIYKSSASGYIAGGECVGGLAGCGIGHINNSYSMAQIQGVTQVGGLCGGIGAAADTDCFYQSYSVGPINANTQVGGICGSASYPTYTIYGRTSYWDINTTKQTNNVGGGSGKITTDMYQSSTYVGWDFTSDNPQWKIDNGHGYPIPIIYLF